MTNKSVIKSSKSGLTILLDEHCTFDELLTEIKHKFAESSQFWGNAQMTLSLEGRELSAAEELQITDAVISNSGIEILCLLDHNAKRIERCEKALNQRLMELSAHTGQFYRGNLNSGEYLESETSIVIIGNVRKGARVISKGNIIILGELSGTVHAGVSGNTEALIAALDMAPKSLKIASCSLQADKSGRKCARGPAAAVSDCQTILIKPFKKKYFNILHDI